MLGFLPQILCSAKFWFLISHSICSQPVRLQDSRKPNISKMSCDIKFTFVCEEQINGSDMYEHARITWKWKMGNIFGRCDMNKFPLYIRPLYTEQFMKLLFSGCPSQLQLVNSAFFLEAVDQFILTFSWSYFIFNLRTKMV